MTDPAEFSFDDLYNEINLASAPNLGTLPIEIFMKICTFLDGSFVSETLSQVCKRFNEILSDQSLWKYWVGQRVGCSYPLTPHIIGDDNEDFTWEKAYVEIDREETNWKDVKRKHIVIKDVHYACVDCIRLFHNGNLCVSGSRDRGVALWKTECVEGAKNLVKMKADAHKGWVWGLGVSDATSSPIIYSGSWDNTIKVWDIETGLNCLDTYQCGLSVLSVIAEENLIIAGLCVHKVMIFDRRVGGTPVASYSAHRGSVLSLSSRNGLISSAGEDHTIAVWEQKASKILVSGIKLPGAEKAYPSKLNWGPLGLLVGDSRGSVHLLTVQDETLSLKESVELWDGGLKVTGVTQRSGCVVACCDKGTVKFLHPSIPPNQFASVTSKTKSVTGLQYENDVLAVSTTDCAIEFWVPEPVLTNTQPI